MSSNSHPDPGEALTVEIAIAELKRAIDMLESLGFWVAAAHAQAAVDECLRPRDGDCEV